MALFLREYSFWLLAEISSKLILGFYSDLFPTGAYGLWLCFLGKIPFCFLLVGDDGYRLELQAESEDEMLK